MERYIYLKEQYYYDCLNNKIIQARKPMSKTIKNNNCRFLTLYNDDSLRNNINSNRQQLILSVTEQCNLRCEYCAYYDDRYEKNTPLSHMTFETARIAIDDYISHSYFAEKRCISFYGGEPLLNFDLIKECVGYVESLNLNKPMLYLFTTNGTTLSENIAEYAYNKKFMVNISLDGPSNIHDRYRKNVGDHKTFEKIINASKVLIALDQKYWKSSIHFFSVLAPPIDMKSTLDFFEVMPYNYSLTDMIMTDHMKRHIEQQTDVEIMNGQESDVDYKSYLRQHNAMADELRLVRKILQRNVITGKFFAPGSYCFPFVRRLFVSAIGDYYICEKYDQDIASSFGNVRDGIDIDKLMDLQQKVLDFHNKNCKQCWATRFCGICFATMNKFPDCCENYKNIALSKLKDTVEDSYV